MEQTGKKNYFAFIEMYYEYGKKHQRGNKILWVIWGRIRKNVNDGVYAVTL